MPMDPLITGWLEALEERHLADLTMSEVARALRALSSCYVERRAKLAEGGALSSSGKRAAFALFYGPQHLLVTQEILKSLPSGTDPMNDVDRPRLRHGRGRCGVGAGGTGTVHSRVRPPSVGDCRGELDLSTVPAAGPRRCTRTSRRLACRNANPLASRPVPLGGAGPAFLRPIRPTSSRPTAGPSLLTSLLEAHARGSRVLVIEPIARRALPWWGDWQTAVERAGGRADEWRFAVDLPPTQLALARAAGLAPRELTARSLFL